MQSSRKARPTIADVAKAAGLSVATVDRVLNRRAPVKEETAQRVLEAARRVGFHAARLIHKRVEEGLDEFRLGFLLQGRHQSFYDKLAISIETAVREAPNVLVRLVMDHLDDLSPAAVASAVERLAERCDALAVVAADHPRVTGAVEAVQARGRPVFALLSDLAPTARAGFFGVDHRKAGRTAAWAVARLGGSTGSVAVMVGNHRFHGHELCEIGYRSYLREQAPGLSVLETLMSLEDARLAHELTLDLLERVPDLCGLYVAGGGREGVIAALRDHRGPAPIITVCNELTPESRVALIDGVVDLVIDTPTDRIAQACVRAMLSVLRGGSLEAGPPLPFQLYTAENI